MLSKSGFDHSIFPTFCSAHGNVEYPQRIDPLPSAVPRLSLWISSDLVYSPFSTPLPNPDSENACRSTITNNNIEKQTYVDFVRRLHKLRRFSAHVLIFRPLPLWVVFFKVDNLRSNSSNVVQLQSLAIPNPSRSGYGGVQRQRTTRVPENNIQHMKSFRSQVTWNYFRFHAPSTDKRAGEYQLGQITFDLPTFLSNSPGVSS